MREREQWGDFDGNNGYWYDQLNPAELQAAWELSSTLTFFDAFGMHRDQVALQVILNYFGQPETSQIPVEADAQRIKAAIEQRAQEIEASNQIQPPSIEDIRASLKAKSNHHK